MIIQNKRIIASILFVLISFVSIAQGTPPPPAPPPPPGLPIDSGIIALLVLGLFLGIYSIVKILKTRSKI